MSGLIAGAFWPAGLDEVRGAKVPINGASLDARDTRRGILGLRLRPYRPSRRFSLAKLERAEAPRQTRGERRRSMLSANSHEAGHVGLVVEPLQFATSTKSLIFKHAGDEPPMPLI